MAKRGRKPKTESAVVKTQLTVADYEKTLKKREEEQLVQLETMYIKLAKIRNLIENGMDKLHNVDDCESLSAVGFQAGRAFANIAEASVKLEKILDDIYDDNNFDYYSDIEND